MFEEDVAMISPGKHHRITMPTKFLLIITASLLFPPLGGVLQLLSLEAKHFDVLHTQLEARLQTSIGVAKIEKSALLKTIEFMELAG